MTALDRLDLAILAAVRAFFEAADPVPADLTGRIRFAIALTDPAAALARLREDLLIGSGAGGIWPGSGSPAP